MTPNDLKLSDWPARRGPCAVGERRRPEAGAVTRGPVRCSAWLGVIRLGTDSLPRLRNSPGWEVTVRASEAEKLAVRERMEVRKDQSRCEVETRQRVGSRWTQNA